LLRTILLVSSALSALIVYIARVPHLGVPNELVRWGERSQREGGFGIPLNSYQKLKANLSIHPNRFEAPASDPAGKLAMLERDTPELLPQTVCQQRRR